MYKKLKNNKINIKNLDLIKLNITNTSIKEKIETISAEDYTKYINFLNHKTDINDIMSNYSDNEISKDLIELDEFLNNLCEETYNNQINYINETKILLDCDKNNYYKNYYL